ncbi:MAG: hypothetical protein PUK79_11040 [Clostridiales bacterium]|nr:hypothetical protein [Clostridiales bacterium]MDY2835969.1 hypothetical protein [Candidatus Aphodomonas sp.]
MPDRVQDFHLIAIIKAGGRLVHDKIARLLRQRARNQHHLPLSAGKLLKSPVRQRRQFQPFKRRHCFAIGITMRNAGSKMRYAPHEHHLAHLVGKRQRRGLRHIGHTLCSFAVGQRAQALAVEHDGTALGRVKPQKAAQQRGFARTVRSKQADDFAAGDRKGYVPQNRAFRLVPVLKIWFCQCTFLQNCEKNAFSARNRLPFSAALMYHL